jgi:Fur family transcriptional regulator, peroxide stress response regulator
VAQDETRRLSADEYELFKKACKDGHIRLTPQRLEVFREVINSHDHPSAEDIFNRVKDRLPSISLDTVYRTLSTFETCGLISRIHFSEDRARFDPNGEPHHHLFCVECKAIEDFYWPDFENADLPPETTGWGHTVSRHVQIRGKCSKCSTQENDS